MGCCQTPKVVKEEKKILNIFNNHYKRFNQEDFTISSYSTIYNNTLNANIESFNKLEKKHLVRLNFLKDVSRLIGDTLSKGEQITNVNRSLYFLVVIAILTEKYIEHSILSNKTDMEQIVFNTVNQIVFFKYSNSMFHANVNYYSFKLLVLMLFYVNQIDHLLDIEKYFDIARSSLNSLKSGFSQSPVSVKKGMLQNASRSNVQYNEQKHLKPNIQEEAMFRDLTVIVIGLLCDKTHILMISQSNKTFIQEIILHNLIEHSDEISRLMNYTAKIIKGNFEANDLIDLIYQNPQEKRRFYSILEISTVQVSSKSKNFTNRRLTKLNNLISQPPEDELARMGKLFDSIGQNLRSFWKYISKFTSDITSGKSTWIEIESHLEKGINDSSKSFNVLELLINYIFSTNRTKVVNQQSSSNKVELQRGSIKEAPITPSTQQINNTLDKPTGYEDYRILIASIFEFLSESISSETPLTFNHKENQRSLYLFHQIIYNYTDVILTDEALNERYMKYLARILFEDCICEILNSQGTLPEEDTEKFLTHVSDIIKLNQEPLRLCFSLLINASKLFYVQKQLNEEDMNTEGEKTIMKDLNNKLLLKVYKKLNSLVTRYFLFKSNKAFLDKDDLFNILFNLTHDNKYHRLYYMNLFISLVKFLLKNYELDLEYKDRRKVYLMVFEMIFELIHNILCYKDYKAVINTYCLLCSFLIEFIRTCDTSFEDYYFIYKSISAISFKLFDLVFTRLQLFMMYFIGLSILMLISIRSEDEILRINLTETNRIFMDKVNSQVEKHHRKAFNKDECEQIKDDYINKEDEDAQNNAVLFAKDIKLNTKSSSLSNQLISLFSGTFIDTNTNDLFIKTDQLKSFFISTYIEDTTPLANYIEILQSKSTKDIHENSDTYVPKGYKNSIYSKSLDSLNIEYFDVESILRKYFDSQAQAKGFKFNRDVTADLIFRDYKNNTDISNDLLSEYTVLVSKRDLEGINDSISFQLNYEQRSEDNMDIARYKSKYGDLGHMEDMLNAKFTVKFSVSKDENNFFNFMNSYNKNDLMEIHRKSQYNTKRKNTSEMDYFLKNIEK